MSDLERQLPSQRVILEGEKQLRFFASVPKTDFSAGHVLARILNERGFAVKISHKGKDIDGQDNEPYLAGNVQLWFSDEATRIAETVKQSPMFQVCSQIRQPADNFVELVEELDLHKDLKHRIIARAFWHRLRYVQNQLETVSSPLVVSRYQEEQRRFAGKIKQYGRPLTKVQFQVLVAAVVCEAETKIAEPQKVPALV